jgi:hypothetical protein
MKDLASRMSLSSITMDTCETLAESSAAYAVPIDTLVEDKGFRSVFHHLVVDKNVIDHASKGTLEAAGMATSTRLLYVVLGNDQGSP